MSLNESIVEDVALEWFGELGYSCLGAEAVAPANGQRESYGEVVLVGRLREAIRRLNPKIPMQARPNINHYLQVRFERRLNP